MTTNKRRTQPKAQDVASAQVKDKSAADKAHGQDADANDDETQRASTENESPDEHRIDGEHSRFLFFGAVAARRDLRRK